MTILIPGDKVTVHVCQSSGYMWGGYDTEEEAQRGMKLMFKKCPLKATVTQCVPKNGTITLAFDEYPGVRMFSRVDHLCFVPDEDDQYDHQS